MSNKVSVWDHPKGLYVLFFTELWERFSYYGMRAIFVLFLTAETYTDGIYNPGMFWERSSALELYGWYTMLVYVMGVPGGWIADRYLGQKKAVMLGGILLCVGHGLLALQSMEFFYTGLGFIIMGVGFLKPNISTMVGQLYAPGDKRRDVGFTLFYIGINVGAFSAPLLVGWVGETMNWHYGFGLAGIGMAIGQIVYVWGQRYLKGIGDFVPKKPQLSNREEENLLDTPQGTPRRQGLTKIEKDRMVVMFISFLLVIVFWGAYEQAGGLMNIYAKEKIDRVVGSFTVPTSFLQALHAFWVIIVGAPVAAFWVWWRRKGRESSAIFKMAVGTVIMGMGFALLVGASYEAAASATGKAALWWMFAAYLLHVLGELSASPVALSFITKLSPARYASIMMGTYFCMSGFGNKLAGLLGEWSETAGERAIFWGIFIFTVVFGLLVILLINRLKALTHGAEDETN